MTMPTYEFVRTVKKRILIEAGSLSEAVDIESQIRLCIEEMGEQYRGRRYETEEHFTIRAPRMPHTYHLEEET